MTKKLMLDFIEETGMVLDFDRKYLMRWDKAHITRLYQQAIAYNEKKSK